MRLVLDTNVVVSALIAHGPPRQLLFLGQRRRVSLFTSEPLLGELAGVIRRGKFARMPDLRRNTPVELALRYRLATNVVSLGSVERVVPSDPTDDIVIATAVAADADVLVTGDKGILSLDPYGDIRILSPMDALGTVQATLQK